MKNGGRGGDAVEAAARAGPPGTWRAQRASHMLRLPAVVPPKRPRRRRRRLIQLQVATMILQDDQPLQPQSISVTLPHVRSYRQNSDTTSARRAGAVVARRVAPLRRRSIPGCLRPMSDRKQCPFRRSLQLQPASVPHPGDSKVLSRDASGWPARPIAQWPSGAMVRKCRAAVAWHVEGHALGDVRQPMLGASVRYRTLWL